MTAPLDIVVLGLSITSSWGNGHATTYRSLMRPLAEAGHRILFLERNVPWYAQNRDLPDPPYARTILYDSISELVGAHASSVRDADLVIVGSYVPDGIAVGDWVLATAEGVTAFYDIDTPVTLAQLSKDTCAYLEVSQIPGYDLYLSFTGGPTLDLLEQKYASPAARPLYCSVDPRAYYRQRLDERWHLGYMGTYSDDRQPSLERLLLAPAASFPEKNFVVAGPQYPPEVVWPENVERIEHLAPAKHCAFYGSQRFTLNVTRAEMARAGYAPSVRLFEAAACAVPIISDYWTGLEEFFEPGREILIAEHSEDVLRHLRDTSEQEAMAIGDRAQRRVLFAHTAAHRAQQLLTFAREVRQANTRSSILS